MGGFLGVTSGFISSSLLKLKNVLSDGGSGISPSKLLLLWQLESGLAIGTITGERVSSSSGSRTYLAGVSSKSLQPLHQ